MSSEVRDVPLAKVLAALIDYRGKTPTKTASGVKLITAKVIKGGRVADENHEFIADDHYDIWMRRGLPRQWDILITTEAPLGEVAMLRTPERVALAQRVILLRADPAVADQKYLFQALKSQLVQARLNARATGTTVLGIKQSELVQVAIPLPALSEQRRIASILSAYDDLIENNTRRIAILEEMARRIYEEWFIRFRFPGHEGVRMVESELGLVPEGWSVAPLGDVVKLLSGFAFKSSTFSEDGSFGLVTIKNVHDGEFVEECTSRLSDPPLNMPQHCNLNVADILLSLTGNVGRCCLVTLAGCLLNQRVAKIEPIKSFDWAYSYLLFRSIQHRERLEAIANGVAQQNLSPVESQRMRLVIPAEAMRRRFAEVVTHLLRLRLTLDLKNTNLRTTRDLLLPKLISGELNVSAMPEPEALAI